MSAAVGVRLSPAPQVLVAALAGTAVGLAAATLPLAAAVLIIAPLYGALALRRLPIAVALWIPLMFIEGLPGSRLAPEAAGLFVGLGWVVALHQGRIRLALGELRPLLLALGVCLMWFAMSLLWARDIAAAAGYAWYFAEVAVFLLIVATVPQDQRTVRLFCAMFVVGALLSVAIGVIGLAGGSGSVQQGSRLQGGAGDPNYFAAALMPALAIALGLARASATPAARRLALLACLPLIVGVAASQSRGALVAVAVMTVAALIVFPRERRALVIGISLIFAIGGLYFVADPGAWNRITHDQYGGSGREDLWLVASRVARDNPVLGVGLANFEIVSPSYVREPGRLTYVNGILRGQEPHNVYLGMLAEVGAIGLLAFLAIPFACLWLALDASRRYARGSQYPMSVLARASFVGLVGALTTSFFLPNAADKRLWILMGVVAALYRVSRVVRRPTIAAA